MWMLSVFQLNKKVKIFFLVFLGGNNFVTLQTQSQCIKFWLYVTEQNKTEDIGEASITFAYDFPGLRLTSKLLPCTLGWMFAALLEGILKTILYDGTTTLYHRGGYSESCAVLFFTRHKCLKPDKKSYVLASFDVLCILNRTYFQLQTWPFMAFSSCHSSMKARFVEFATCPFYQSCGSLQLLQLPWASWLNLKSIPPRRPCPYACCCAIVFPFLKTATCNFILFKVITVKRGEYCTYKKMHATL